MRSVRAATIGMLALALVAACSPAAEQRAPVTVFAAASLHDAFEDIARAFEAERPDIDVRPIVSDGSSVLVTQLEEGADADVLATADEQTMTRAADLAGPAEVFATNTLVLVASVGGAVDELADLADRSLDVVLCAPEVPCGAASRALLERAGIAVVPASEEQNVTAVLTKVETGVADAGLVYRTDAIGRDVTVTEPPEAADIVNRYPIAVLDDAREPDAAAAFAAFVSGPEGQRILDRHGFGAPGAP